MKQLPVPTLSGPHALSTDEIRRFKTLSRNLVGLSAHRGTGSQHYQEVRARRWAAVEREIDQILFRHYELSDREVVAIQDIMREHLEAKE